MSEEIALSFGFFFFAAYTVIKDMYKKEIPDRDLWVILGKTFVFTILIIAICKYLI